MGIRQFRHAKHIFEFCFNQAFQPTPPRFKRALYLFPDLSRGWEGNAAVLGLSEHKRQNTLRKTFDASPEGTQPSLYLFPDHLR